MKKTINLSNNEYCGILRMLGYNYADKDKSTRLSVDYGLETTGILCITIHELWNLLNNPHKLGFDK